MVKTLNEDTLCDLRRFWSLYADTKSLSGNEAQAFEARVRTAIAASFTERFSSKEGEKVFAYQGFRSAGAHGMLVALAMSSAFEGYWKTGVVAGNRADVASLGHDQKGCVNPMMAFSSAPTGKFSVHYGSDPLLGFHLAEVFDQGDSTSDKADKLTKVAKSQFQSWCISFAKYLRNDAVQIVVHSGEAVNLCYALQSYQPALKSLSKLTHSYNRPWSARALTLVEAAGTSLAKAFDVIDTSNLNDHIGILNILPAAAPLLSHNACSVLYTESLLLSAEDTSKSLTTLMFSDISAISLVMGIAPVGSLLGTTIDSVGNEILSALITGRTPGKQQQFRMRVPWKRASLEDGVELLNSDNTDSVIKAISIDSKELATYFFGLYLKMFAFENLSSLFSSLQRQLSTPLAGDLRFYSRLSLVALLHLAKGRIGTDWERCIETLLDMIGNDRSLLVSSNSMQELYMHLHLSGLWRNPMLEQNPRTEATQFGSPRSTSDETGLLRLSNVPPLVHVALVVPRSKLKIFTDESPDSVGTPGLHISITQEGMYDNSFFAIDCFFGRLVPVSDTVGLCNIQEDPEGWKNHGDLIVTCPVPSFSLLTGPRKGIRVSLVVNTAPSTVQFTQKLGVRMKIYECGLDDEKHLQVLRVPPGFSEDKQQGISKVQPLSCKYDPTSFPLVSLNHDGTIRSISVHTGFPEDSEECKLLKSGASVTVSQQSPCKLHVRIGEKSCDFVYPYPVNGFCCKTKISRKQSWIEVAAPISPAHTRGGFEYDPFPVTLHNLKPAAWSFGRTNISQQPIISADAKYDWLNTHLGMTVSQTERDTQEVRDARGGEVTALVDLKESISILFLSSVGQNPATFGRIIRSFRLAKNNNSDTLLFIKSLCHDRDTGSILLDAFVVQLTDARMNKVHSPLQNLVQREAVLGVSVTDEEAVLWKQLFPALVERCRFSWEHKKTCEYISESSIPLSTAFGQMSICTCGEGIDAKDFPPGFSGFAKLATRVAIAPISAVPYVESLIPRDLPKQISQTMPSQLRNVMGPSSVDHPVGTACSHCGAAKDGLKSCARCGKARYCNHACQKAAWKAHKKECQK